MSSITLEINKTLDFTFLKESLLSEDEIKQINPTASFPFDESYWRNFFVDDCRSYSLLFEVEGQTIAHAALKEREGKVFLCLLYLDKNFRGRGISKDIISKVELFVKKNFQTSELYLNVLHENYIAKSLYEKLGYRECASTDSSLQMKKEI